MRNAATHQEGNAEPKPSLYVVATPIGNLRDISLRALDVLSSVDAVVAEDTRVTGRLLNHHGISSRLIALHEHNERRMVPRVLALLTEGKSVALVSDAGTPAISDPGARLVAAAVDAGFPVVPVPGPSAVVTALCVAGLNTPHFLFYGFLPARAGERKRELASLGQSSYPLVFFEAPHRIVESVSDMYTVFGGVRRIVIARELTKLFESIHACTLAEAVRWLEEDPDRRRGEFVLILEGAPKTRAGGGEMQAQHVLEALLAELPLKRAVMLATRITGAARNELYALALKLKGARKP